MADLERWHQGWFAFDPPVEDAQSANSLTDYIPGFWRAFDQGRGRDALALLCLCAGPIATFIGTGLARDNGCAFRSESNLEALQHATIALQVAAQWRDAIDDPEWRSWLKRREGYSDWDMLAFHVCAMVLLSVVGCSTTALVDLLSPNGPGDRLEIIDIVGLDGASA